MSMFKEAGDIKNTVILIFRHIKCLHLMYSEVAWVLVSLGTQGQPLMILDPDYVLGIFPFLVAMHLGRKAI